MHKSFVKDLKHTENINVFRKISDRGGVGASNRKNQDIHSSYDFSWQLQATFRTHTYIKYLKQGVKD